jgi:hypothetical protein
MQSICITLVNSNKLSQVTVNNNLHCLLNRSKTCQVTHSSSQYQDHLLQQDFCSSGFCQNSELETQL